MDELLYHDEGNPSRSLAPSELSGARLPRLLFESMMNGARKYASVLGASLRWPVFQSSIRPKPGPGLTATPCFYPGSGCTPDQAVSRVRFQKKAVHFFYQPSYLSVSLSLSASLLTCFLWWTHHTLNTLTVTRLWRMHTYVVCVHVHVSDESPEWGAWRLLT